MLKTAVVVEDCKATIRMMEFLLRKLGVKQVLKATNSSEFDDLMKEQITPDIVITDWNIDNTLKGKDVISAMQKFNTPIAVVTSEEQKDIQLQRCRWFTKPLNTNAFATWLKQICS